VKNYKIKSSGKIMADKTNQELISELKKTKRNIQLLNQEKLRLKYNYDLEKDLNYRKMISEKHCDNLIQMALQSPVIETQQWGTRLNSVKRHDMYH
jgi:hypothetical protein